MYIYDIEVFRNYFLVVFINYTTKEIIHFELGVEKNDIPKLLEFLKTNPKLIGYNNLGYDAQILQYIIENPKCIVEDIVKFNDLIIASAWPPYREKQLSTNNLDLMVINNYGARSAKSTNLKQLEFNLRRKVVKDSPYDWNHHVQNEKERKEIIKYCIEDCDVLFDVITFTKDLIDLRLEFGNLHNINLLNTTEPDFVKKYFTKAIASKMGINEYEFSQLRTYHDKVEIKDVIFPFLKFNLPIYNEVLEFYKSAVLYPTVKSTRNPEIKVINLKKALSKSIEFKGLVTEYGAGGIHGCVTPGVYRGNDEYMITTFDKKSFYPHLQFKHGLSPAHIDPKIYCETLEDTYNTRDKYNKKTHYTLNYAYKILINVVFGLSNSEYSPFYDTKCTLGTTINGMLDLSMHADLIYTRIPSAVILMKNTDGMEIYHKRKDLPLLLEVFEYMKEIDRIPYEYDEYGSVVVRDINNYLATNVKGETEKSKGCFETYDDIVKIKAYNKDTSEKIIPLALKEYYINDVPVEETIENCNNIHEFLIGVKGSKDYVFVESFLTDTSITNKVFNTRLIRYYASKPTIKDDKIIGKSCTLSKLWKPGTKSENEFEKLTASSFVTKAQTLLKPELVVRNKKGEITTQRYLDLNKEYYIAETYKIINKIDNTETL